MWHVRHSALFALPAILSRLSYKQRKALALNTLLPLAEDTSSSVRIGVLEAIGEVVYTFHDDNDAVPEELLELFIGRRDTHDRDNEPHDTRKQPPRDDWPEHNSWADGYSPATSIDDGEPRTIWNDPSRPLICAFNYPAVALTLGRDRWPELRDLYRDLSRNDSVKVRRTLAASLGELAIVVGVENARTDLMDVFKASIRADEGDVRAKAVESLQTFITAISDENRWEVLELLDEAWKAEQLKGWREREGVVRLLGVLVELETDVWLSAQNQTHRVQLLKAMVMRGLQDGVASVRDAAVCVMPAFSKSWKARRPTALNGLLEDVQAMSGDLKYTRRMTFVACQQQLVLANEDVGSMVHSEVFRRSLELLVSDNIVGVRIGVARLLGELGGECYWKVRADGACFTDNTTDKYHQNAKRQPDWILRLVQQLANDSSEDVRSFVASVLDPAVENKPDRPTMLRHSSSDLPLPTTFSRPPRSVGIGTEKEPTTAASVMDHADGPSNNGGPGLHDNAGSSAGDAEMQGSRTTNQPVLDNVAVAHSSPPAADRPHLVRTESKRLLALS